MGKDTKVKKQTTNKKNLEKKTIFDKSLNTIPLTIKHQLNIHRCEKLPRNFRLRWWTFRIILDDKPGICGAFSNRE